MDFPDRRVGGFVPGHRSGRDDLFRLMGHQLLRAQPRWNQKWSFPSGGIIDSSPAIGADGTIYFGSHDKKFYALNPDGTKKWDFATGGQIISSPAIGADGTIYFSSTDGNLYALHPDGTELWRLRTGGAAESSPVLDSQGVIYLDVNNMATAVSGDGKKLWDFGGFLPLTLHRRSRRTARFISRPVAGLDRAWAGRAIALASDIGQQHQCLSSHRRKWDNLCDGRMVSRRAGRHQRPTAAGNSSWPMFRANPRHTGRVSDPSKP